MVAMSNTVRRQRLEELEGQALKRLARILDKGGDRDALEAASMILKRTMPEPKTSTADVAKAAAIGASAGASHLAALASKARARLSSPVDIADSTDATFAPVSRVQTSE